MRKRRAHFKEKTMGGLLAIHDFFTDYGNAPGRERTAASQPVGVKWERPSLSPSQKRKHEWSHSDVAH